MNKKESGTILFTDLVPAMSRWGHCGFILLIARKEFNLVTSEFPHLHNWKCALASLFFCWRTKERKWLFSPNTHTLVTIPAKAGRELDNGSCRCGGIFSNPLSCCCLAGSRDRAMEEQKLLLDKHSKHFCFIEDLVKLSSNSQPQPVPSCSRGWVSNRPWCKTRKG